MLETPHVAVGAAIASKIPNPFIAIPLAFGSHFVLEKVPHWNPHLKSETKKYGRPTKQSTYIVIADVALSLVIGFSVASTALPNTAHALTILAACFVSALPDIVEGPYFFLNMRSKLIERWIKFQSSIQSNATLVPGLLTQFATVVAAIFWVLN